MRAGIWVGGGAQGGFIRNTQFNPHYATRLPKGGQGYPVPGGREFWQFVQGNCSAFRFGDVKNQTIFNNFVYASVYGIHFIKDAKTGNYPGEILVVGHGSDGCTFALYVEEAGKDTKIIAINSELVNTLIKTQDVRAYIKMGDVILKDVVLKDVVLKDVVLKDENVTEKVHPNANLILYNSAFWGSPTIGAIINNGIVRFYQANFSKPGEPCIDIHKGKVLVYSSYFAHHSSEEATHARLHGDDASIELSNNYYNAKLNIQTF
jgi:hypothetical protein